LALVSKKVLVDIVHRTVVGVKLSWWTPQTLEFLLVNSFGWKEIVSMVVWCVGQCGEMRSAIEVVMVIMTSDGAPTGGAHRFGTGEIFLSSCC